MNENEKLITRFYTAFQARDYSGMQACYSNNISFSDNAFPNLKGNQARAMWHMLLESSTDLQVTYSNIKSDGVYGYCNWTAVYTFTLTGNKVTNHVKARFVIRDGKITEHDDNFSFWKWSSQALGLSGKLLGWTPILKNKVRSTAGKRLKNFIARHPEYQ
jgi:ketosteroid isomerase-like protein